MDRPANQPLIDDLISAVRLLIDTPDLSQKRIQKRYLLTLENKGLFLVKNRGSNQEYEIFFDPQTKSVQQLWNKTHDIHLTTRKNTTLNEAIEMLYDHDRQSSRHPEYHTTAYQRKRAEHDVAVEKETGQTSKERWINYNTIQEAERQKREKLREQYSK